MSSLADKLYSTPFGQSHKDVAGQGALLFERLQQLFESHPSLGAIDRSAGNSQKLRILSYQTCEVSSLMSATEDSSGHSFNLSDHSLLYGWLAYIIAENIKLPVSVTKDLFVAGLVWPVRTEETAVGASSLMDSLPSAVQALVMETTKHYDRSVAPAGHFEYELSRESQVLAVASEIIDALFRYRDEDVLSFEKALPVLKLNAALYFREVYNKAVYIISVRLIEPTEAEEQRLITVDQEQISSIVSLHHRLMLRWPAVLQATADLTVITAGVESARLLRLANRAWLLVTTAGILSYELIDWISQLRELDQERSQVVMEIDVLLNELNYLVNCFRDQLDEMLNNKNIMIEVAARGILSDLCVTLGESEESCDDDEFMLHNICK